MTFTLMDTGVPGSLDVAGTMDGLAEARFVFHGRLEGHLACGARRLTANILDASVNVGDLGTYLFEGELTAVYVPASLSLTGGSWNAHQTGGGPAVGGRGVGIWAGVYTP
jgi:hypothetical protein